MHLNIKTRLRNIRLHFLRGYYHILSNRGGKSLFCNNCTGAVVLHEYHQRFDTPTVNLFLMPDDYIEFLRDLKTYSQCQLEDVTGDSSYPIGRLAGKVTIHFLHYPSFVEAERCWKRRCNRIHWDKLYVSLVESDGCTYEHLKQFDALPYPHKVALVHRPYSEIKCAFPLTHASHNGKLRQVLGYYGWFGKRYYDEFDWLRFLELK